MEIVVAIMLLVVPVVAVAALLMALRTFTQVKALKGLVIDLSKGINQINAMNVPQKPTFVDNAMQDYQMRVI